MNFFEKAKDNKILKCLAYVGIVVASIAILSVLFGLGYILIKSSNVAEGIGNIEKLIGLVGIPSGVGILISINKKLSKILSK